MSDATSMPETRSQQPVLLQAHGVAKSYRMAGERLEVLRGVDLEVHQGEILAVLGKSGCGKSTLLHVLGWLDRPDAGQIIFEGRDHSDLPGAERARMREEGRLHIETY